MHASGRRLPIGTDYTEAVTGTTDAKTVTATIRDAVPTTDQICIIYQSPTVAVFPQAPHHAVATFTRPAAIKGRDIEIRIGGTTITDRWFSVQSVTVEQRLNVEKDGVRQLPGRRVRLRRARVSGSIEIRPRDVQELLKRVRQIAGITNPNEVIGPNQAVRLPIEIRLHSPDTGQVLKTLAVPDARFTMPGFSGQVQQKLNVTFNFESDGGKLLAFKGAPGASYDPLLIGEGTVGEGLVG